MAKELEADFLTGKTIYFLLRNSVGQIWNGSAFEVYGTSSYSTYSITATEQGSSGFYVADIPNVTEDVYNVIAKNQSGGSPVVGDATVATGDVFWTGTLVGITTLAMASAAVSSIMTHDITGDQSSAAIHSLLSMILKLVSKFDSLTGKTYRLDGTTVHMTQTPTTNSSLVPVQKLDVSS